MHGPKPEIFECELRDEEVADLLRDLGACAEIVSIKVRSRLDDAPDASPVALAEVGARLEAGAAVQITYRHGGSTWIDTLRRIPGAIRLVRIGHGTPLT